MNALSLRMTAAALLVAGSACGPLVESAAASPRHHDASRSAHLRHHDARRSAHLRHHLTIIATRKADKATVRVRNPRLVSDAHVPSISVRDEVITWGGSYRSSQLLGAVSTAPRGSATRQTTYVSLSAGKDWTLEAQPGQTLYYGVDVDHRWSSNEIEISWPAATTPTSGTSAGKSGTSAGTSGTTAGTSGTTAGTSGTSSTPVSGGPTGTAPTTGSSSSSMLVGLNEAGFGANGAADVASSFKIDRMDTSFGEDASDFWTRGVAVDMLFSGPYNTGGVSAINPTSWVQNALSTFQSECDGSATNCPSLEVLNEPYGTWFWGPNAEDATNEAAYAHLLVDAYTAFHNQYGSGAPKILAAFDDDSWWEGMEAAVPNIDNYVDGVTVHPYGLTGSVASSALGDQALVIDAHQETGKPLWVTEFGWPTAVGQPPTGDSLQWTFTQQATNTYNFVTWLRSLGYVSAAMDFAYQDYGTNDFYGVETSSGVKKPSWTALSEAADQQPCTVCA
jgi:hypothetical protein